MVHQHGKVLAEIQLIQNRLVRFPFFIFGILYRGSSPFGSHCDLHTALLTVKKIKKVDRVFIERRAISLFVGKTAEAGNRNSSGSWEGSILLCIELRPDFAPKIGAA